MLRNTDFARNQENRIKTKEFTVSFGNSGFPNIKNYKERKQTNRKFEALENFQKE